MKEGLLEEEYYSDETPEQSTEDSRAAERQSPVDSSANAINAPLGGRALSSRLSRRLSIRLTDLDTDGSNLKMPKMFKPQDLDFSADQ